MGRAHRDGFESSAPASRQTRRRTHPQGAVPGFLQGFDASSRESVVFGEKLELASVVAEQPVLSSYPEESLAILQDHLHGEIPHSFFLTVELEVVALGF